MSSDSGGGLRDINGLADRLDITIHSTLWGDSYIYLRRSKKRLLLTVEHRAAAGIADIELELAEHGRGPALRPRKDAAAAGPGPESPGRRILAVVAAAQGPLSATDIRRQAGTRHATVSTELARLCGEGRIARLPDGRYRSAAPAASAAGNPEQSDMFPNATGTPDGAVEQEARPGRR